MYVPVCFFKRWSFSRGLISPYKHQHHLSPPAWYKILNTHPPSPSDILHEVYDVPVLNLELRTYVIRGCGGCVTSARRTNEQVAGLKKNKGLHGIIERLRQTATLADLS